MNKTARGGLGGTFGVILGIILVIAFFPTIFKASLTSSKLISNPIIMIIAVAVLVLIATSD